MTHSPVAEAIRRNTGNPSSLARHYGTVVSIQTTPTQSLTMTIDGGTENVTGIQYLDSYAPAVGDVCWLIRRKSSYFVLGVIATSPQWQTYTPTWTAGGGTPSLGNGQLYGRYTQQGQLVVFRINLTWGSTSNGSSGRWVFALPAETSASNGPQTVHGFAYQGQAGSNSTLSVPLPAGSTTTSDGLWIANSPTLMVTATQPWSWATGDVLTIEGTYEST